MRSFLLGYTMLCLFGMAALGAARERSPLIIERADFNYAVGIDSSFYQFNNYHMGSTGILPFNPAHTEWDFSALTTGVYATVQVLDPTTTPGSGSFPGATGCSRSTIGGDTSYMYEDVQTDGHYWMGYHASVLGYDIIADFTPDMKAYHFPMQVGTMWYSSSMYTYEISGFPVTATESHQSEVVAQGRVMTHDIPYWMECLVIKTYHSYSDSWGSSDNYWLYEWVVPNGFSGGNGVVALMSQKDATSDFVFCRYALFLGPTNIAPDLPLMSDTDVVSELGGTVNFDLDAAEINAGRFYVMLGSVTGTSPGTPLPGGHVVLPLNWDPVTKLIRQLLNSPVLPGFMGTLDGEGLSTAQLNLPPIPPGYVGTIVHFAYALLSPYDYVSNPVAIELVP